MSKDKQIEEMAKVICNSYAEKRDCETCPTPWCYAEECATLLFCAGYRKQSEGEWKVTRTAKRIYIKCTRCNYTKLFDRLESITDERKYIISDFIDEHTFCPNCGAKMRKEDEGNERLH